MAVAKEILGGKHIPNPRETRVSGYIETPVPKACQYCEYFSKGTLCNNRIVLRDTQIPKDSVSGLKIVNGPDGCCNEFEASDESRKKFS